MRIYKGRYHLVPPFPVLKFGASSNGNLQSKTIPTGFVATYGYKDQHIVSFINYK